MQVTLMCCFIVILLDIKRNLATISHLLFELSEKFRRFSATNGSIKMPKKIVEFPKTLVKIKNFKMFYEAQTASNL